jgi:hypothetical protein
VVRGLLNLPTGTARGTRSRCQATRSGRSIWSSRRARGPSRKDIGSAGSRHRGLAERLGAAGARRSFRSIATRASSSSRPGGSRTDHRRADTRSSDVEQRDPTNRVTETGGAATSTRLSTSSAQRPATAGSLPAGNTDRRSLSDTRGVVGVSRIDPGRAFADGEAEFEIRFPEAVRSFVHPALRVDCRPRQATEDRDRAGRWTRDGRERRRLTWERTVPRDLQ